jgi:hypothetical protein
MIRLIHEVETVCEKYGLKIGVLDATDVTLMVRIEIIPSIFFQIYRNLKKNKLNMALVFGNNRIYGIDIEGGITHEHPLENPESHVPINNEPDIEEFILKCIRFLQDRGIL